MRYVGRGSWVVGRGSWVVGRGSWVVAGLAIRTTNKISTKPAAEPFVNLMMCLWGSVVGQI